MTIFSVTLGSFCSRVANADLRRGLIAAGKGLMVLALLFTGAASAWGTTRPVFSYSPSSAVFTLGSAITALTPDNTGGKASSWVIVPALPAGLSFGARDGKEAAKRVSVGDPITFVDDFEMLDDHVVVARALDDRAGAWAAIEALRIARQKKPACALYAAGVQQRLSAEDE